MWVCIHHGHQVAILRLDKHPNSYWVWTRPVYSQKNIDRRNTSGRVRALKVAGEIGVPVPQVLSYGEYLTILMTRILGQVHG